MRRTGHLSFLPALSPRRRLKNHGHLLLVCGFVQVSFSCNGHFIGNKNTMDISPLLSMLIRLHSLEPNRALAHCNTLIFIRI
jgi:hypothetical protein